MPRFDLVVAAEGRDSTTRVFGSGHVTPPAGSPPHHRTAGRRHIEVEPRRRRPAPRHLPRARRPDWLPFPRGYDVQGARARPPSRATVTERMGRAIGAIGTVEVGLAERLADRSSRLDLPTLRRDHVGTTWRQRFSRLGEVWPMIRSAVRTAYVPGIGEITATEPEEIVASRPDEGPPHPPEPRSGAETRRDPISGAALTSNRVKRSGVRNGSRKHRRSSGRGTSPSARPTLHFTAWTVTSARAPRPLHAARREAPAGAAA